MTAEQFAYWLQGFSELNPAEQPTPAQWAAIQDHLKLVFTKVTPERSAQESTQDHFQRLLRDGGLQAVPHDILRRTETIC